MSKRSSIPVEQAVCNGQVAGSMPAACSKTFYDAALVEIERLMDAGHLAVVPGVGYPNPSRSHFTGMAVWHTARLDPADHTGYGWLGRALDSSSGSSCAVHGSARDPRQLAGPGENSATNRLFKSFAGLSATIAFEEDGLRVVVTIERKE